MLFSPHYVKENEGFVNKGSRQSNEFQTLNGLGVTEVNCLAPITIGYMNGYSNKIVNVLLGSFYMKF